MQNVITHENNLKLPEIIFYGIKTMKANEYIESKCTYNKIKRRHKKYKQREKIKLQDMAKKKT